MDTQWTRLSPETVAVATTKSAWLYKSNDLDILDRYGQSMKDIDGSIDSTQNLLDAAIAAAKYAVNSDVRPPALTAKRWIWRLAGAYHLTHPAPQLFKEAARRFALKGHSMLADWAAEKAKEEAGHDLLALRDIKSLGYDAEAVVKELVPPAAQVLIDYFTRSIQDDNPIDCVGYSYTMERMALGVGEEYIQKIEALLPPGINATRCQRTHSSVGADAEHVEETVEMIAELTSQERVRIVRACYETALMCFSPAHKGYMTDEMLQPILSPLKLDKSLVGV
ncbi:MAG: iron-containing redox enzyme family protein, partial [Waterburya sp.]